MLNKILSELTPTTTQAMNTTFWILLVLGIVAAFSVFAVVLTTIEDRIQRALTEAEPIVDDVAEQRLRRADLFAERRRQLDALAIGRRQ